MSESLAPAVATPHLRYLDAVRGIAASMVVFYHFLGWKYPDANWFHWSSMLFNGSDAVSFFFVLSGMVLTYRYLALGNSLDLRKFYVNRFMRLFPAFFVCMLVNAIYANRQDLSLHNLWEVFGKNRDSFWEEALLVREHPNYFIPSWTLAVELAISFFIPFMVVIARKERRLIFAFIIATLLVARVHNQFFLHFFLGMALSAWFHEIRSSSFRSSFWWRFRVPLLLIALVLFSIRHIDRMSPLGPSLKYLLSYLQVDFFSFTGVASFAFLAALIQSDAAQRFFSNRFFLFIGRISYGIYLMHWTLVTATFNYWDQLVLLFPDKKTAFVTLCLLVYLMTLMLATLLHYCVELPFMRLGRKWTQHLKPSLVV